MAFILVLGTRSEEVTTAIFRGHTASVKGIQTKQNWWLPLSAISFGGDNDQGLCIPLPSPQACHLEPCHAGDSPLLHPQHEGR